MFFYLLRSADADLDRAASEVVALTSSDESRDEFMRFLKLDRNSEIREIYEKHVPPFTALS